MLLYTVAWSLRVDGDSFRDGSGRSLDSPESQCSIGFQPVFRSHHRMAFFQVAIVLPGCVSSPRFKPGSYTQFVRGNHRSAATIIELPGKHRSTLERNTGRKPMLLYAAVAPLRVHGESPRDGSESTLNNTESLCYITPPSCATPGARQ